jgi:hypothetical protein
MSDLHLEDCLNMGGRGKMVGVGSDQSSLKKCTAVGKERESSQVPATLSFTSFSTSLLLSYKPPEIAPSVNFNNSPLQPFDRKGHLPKVIFLPRHQPPSPPLPSTQATFHQICPSRTEPFNQAKICKVLHEMYGGMLQREIVR